MNFMMLRNEHVCRELQTRVKIIRVSYIRQLENNLLSYEIFLKIPASINNDRTIM
jgi:hypothetical protein